MHVDLVCYSWTDSLLVFTSSDYKRWSK